jgi:hypothetical protein
MTMRLWFNVPTIKCVDHDDSGPHAEYYFTYQAYFDLDDQQRSLTQGFSQGCPLDDGYALRKKEERVVNDPKFLFNLPELEVGKSNVVTLDVYLWESDHSTIETKKVFTNAAALKLWEIYNAAAQQKQKTKDEFFKWLQDQGIGLVADAATVLGASAAVGAAMVTVGKALIPFVSWAIDLAKNNSDDFVGMSRIQLVYKRLEQGYKYRRILNDGAGIAWIPNEERPLDVPVDIRAASGADHVAAHMLMQLVFDAERLTTKRAESLGLAVGKIDL